MPSSQLHYLPLTLPFFAILVGALAFLVVFLEVSALRYAYMRIGLSSRGAVLVLLGTLVGSYFNVPLWELPARQVMSGQEVTYFGMHYVVPVAVDWPGTLIAVNVGGAVIPSVISLYLLDRYHLWIRGLVAITCIAGVTHLLANPVPGLGIAVPVFVPAIAAATVALLLSPSRAAPLAYVGGSIGTLVGADLLNLGRVQGLGAPVASIGGAGTFDGIFLTGVMAAFIAGFSWGSGRAAARR